MMHSAPNWMVRYALYAFVFSLPFETADIGTVSTLPRLFGLGLALAALLQRQVCYRTPPKAFWWFAAYVCGYGLYGFYLVFTLPEASDIAILPPLRTFVQLLILFWISYNLMRYERIVKGVLWALAGGTLTLSILQIIGITADVGSTGRVTAFEANPNVAATVLSVGLLALVGLAYARGKYDWKGRVLLWMSGGIFGVAIIQTGSRGALVGLVASLLFLFLRGRSLTSKIKFAVIAAAGIIFLVGISYQMEPVRKRWEQTIYEGNLAGREKIFPIAVEMILEKPLFGWGPIYHTWELGARLGLPNKDAHNLYLSLLTEAGVVGAFPFFVALWLCWLSAWKARHSLQGFMPAIMLCFVLIISVKSTPTMIKYFWVVLAYGLASGSYVAVTSRVTPLVSRYNLRRAHGAPLPRPPRRVVARTTTS